MQYFCAQLQLLHHSSPRSSFITLQYTEVIRKGIGQVQQTLTLMSSAQFRGLSTRLLPKTIQLVKRMVEKSCLSLTYNKIHQAGPQQTNQPWLLANLNY